MIYYVFLCISAIIFSSQFLITKQYQRIKGTGFFSTVRLTLFAYLTIAVFFFLKGCISSGEINFGFSPFTFLMTLGIACVSFACVYLGIQVLSVGNMGIYSAFMMLGSLVLPSIVGIVFYDEGISAIKTVAVSLMIVSVVFSVVGTKETKFNPKAIFFYVAIFVLNGLVGVLFTIHQNSPSLTALPLLDESGNTVVNSDLFMSWYGISTALLCSVLLCAKCFVKRENAQETETAQNGRTAFVVLGLAVLYGICNGVGNYFIALGTQPGALGASVTFPIVNGGTILFSTVLGTVVYKEKIRWNMLVCLCLVVVSTVLFMYA